MRDVHFEKSNSEHNETRSTKKCTKKEVRIWWAEVLKIMRN
jgi:hypothetical protein